MPVSGHQELGIDLASRKSSDSVSGVPIKKRRFHLSQSSSSAAKELAIPTQDHVRPSKKTMISDPEFSILDNRDNLALGTLGEKPNMFSFHGQKYVVDQVNLEDSALQRVHEPPVGKGSITEEFASTDISLLKHSAAATERHLSSLDDKRFHFAVKEEKVESLSAHPTVNRAKWDLNVPMDTWDATDGTQHDNHDNLIQEKLKSSAITKPPQMGGSSLVSNTSLFERGHLRLSNLGIPSAELRDAEIGLDLQLKPPGRPQLRINWDVALPDLSLSLTGDSSDASCRTKSKEHDNKSPKETEYSQLGGLSSVGSSRIIKSEPSSETFQHQPAKVGGRESKAVSGRVVKPEPHEEQCQEVINELGVKSLDKELVKNKSTPVCPNGHTNTGESIDLNSVAGPDEKLVHDYSSKVPTGSSIDAGEGTGVAVDTSVISGSSKVCEAEEEGSTSCIPQNVGDTNNTSDDVGSVNSRAKEPCSNRKTCGTASMASNLLGKSAVSDVKEPLLSSCLSQGSAEMDCSEGEYYTPIKSIGVNDLQKRSSGKSSKIGRREESMEVTEEIVKKKSQEGDGRRNVTHVVTEGRRVGEKRVPDKDSTDLSVSTHKKLDTEEKEVPVHEQTRNGQSAENISSDLCNDKNIKGSVSATNWKESSSMRVLRASSSSNSLIKLPQGAIKDRFDKVSSPEANPKSTKDTGAKGVPKTGKSVEGSQQENAKDPDTSLKNQVMPDSQLESSVAKSHVEEKSKNTQSNKFSLVPMRVSEKTKPISGPSALSQNDREKLNEKSQRRDTWSSRGSRDEWFRYETDRKQENPVGKRDSTIYGRDSNRQGVVYNNRDLNFHYASENNKSKYNGFRRPYNGPQVPFHTGPGRTMRRVGDNETAHSGPSRRRSPRPREVLLPVSNQTSGPTPRDIRGIDPHLLAHQEEMMGGLPNEAIDPSLYSDQHMLFEQPENGMLQREGRSLSPMQRRIPPCHVPRMRSPPMYIPRANSPDIVLGGHPEVIRHRSRPVVRHNGRSPQRHPGFPDMIIRRHGSPPYSRLPGDIREMRTPMDDESRGHGRFPQRPTRRFELMDRQDTMDEYNEPLHFAQQSQIVEDEFVDSREFDEGYGFAPPYGQHHLVSDDGEQFLGYPGDNDCPGPIRFYPEGEGIGDRESLRLFGGRMRTRGTSLANRVRNMRANERFHNAPEHRDGAFNSFRPKRRRYQP